MKFRFSRTIALAAFFVAGCAAFFSVYGLSQLFAGASLAVIIMASSLEFGKIIAVSLLQRFWSRLSKGLRIYLLIGITVLVCITSAGIYGFLSNAYQKTASKYQVSENEISVLNNKKELFEKDIANNQTIITAKTKRVDQLNNLRNNQETRLDSAKGTANRARVRGDIAEANTEIQTLNKDIDNLNTKNSVLSDSANSYSSKAIDSKSKATGTSEIGPLKYLAALTGYPMDKVVNWFILLLIFVFDPLAVALVISFNKVMELEREADKKTAPIEELITSNVKPTTLGLVGETTQGPSFEVPKELIEAIEKSKTVKEPIEEPIAESIEEHIKNNIKALTIEEPVIEPEPIPEPVAPVVEEVQPEPEIIPEPVPEPLPESEIEPIRRITEEESTKEAIQELIKPEETFKQTPVIPNGKVELQDIKEIKENRGILGQISHIANNAIERIGSNKIVKDGNKDKIFFKRK